MPGKFLGMGDLIAGQLSLVFFTCLGIFQSLEISTLENSSSSSCLRDWNIISPLFPKLADGLVGDINAG
jgi:hypothetical protein